MKRRTVLVSTFAAFALCTAWLPAESQQAQSTYNVEIIVFRAHTAQGGAENWSAEAASGGVSVGAEGASVGTQLGRLVQRLPAASFQLNDVESKLKSSGLYVP